MKKTKFYLVGNDLTRKNEILESEEYPDVFRNRLYNSSTPGYDTLEELKEKAKIPDWPCSKCGGVVKLNYYHHKRLTKKKMCFGCDHFDQIKIDHPNYLSINGVIYTIGKIPKGTPNKFKGFGGTHYYIQRFNDPHNVLFTDNLWHSGTIPDFWKDDYPDNALFYRNVKWNDIKIPHLSGEILMFRNAEGVIKIGSIYTIGIKPVQWSSYEV